MHSKFVAVLALAFGLGVAQAASAADMPMKAPMKAPPLPAPIVYNWTGFYIGINGGGGWGRTSHTDTTGTTSGNFNQSGGLVGGTVGYNWQITSWVLGVEADWDWAHIDGSVFLPGLCVGANCFTNLESFGTARARLGYAWDRWLVYATGGAAWGHISAGQDSCVPGTLCGTKDQLGWTIGGGVEAFVIPKWSVKFEYLYADLGSPVLYTPAIPVNVTEKVNIVRAGVSYHF